MTVALKTLFFLCMMSFCNAWASQSLLHYAAPLQSTQPGPQNPVQKEAVLLGRPKAPSPPFLISTKLRGRSGEILDIRDLSIHEIPARKTLGDLQIQVQSAEYGDMMIVKLSRGASTNINQKQVRQEDIFMLKRNSRLLTILQGNKNPLEIFMQYGVARNLDRREPKSESKDFFDDLLKNDGSAQEKENGNPRPLQEPAPKIDFQKLEKWWRLKNWPKSKEPKSVRV